MYELFAKAARKKMPQNEAAFITGYLMAIRELGFSVSEIEVYGMNSGLSLSEMRIIETTIIKEVSK